MGPDPRGGGPASSRGVFVAEGTRSFGRGCSGSATEGFAVRRTRSAPCRAVKLSHLATVLCAGFLHDKVTVFPLSIDTYLGADTLSLCADMLFVPRSLSADVGLQLWILTAAIITA